MCCYEWRSGALEEFLRVMEVDTKVIEIGGDEILEEPSLMPPTSDVKTTDCQILSSNCSVNASTVHHVMPLISPFPWQLPLERLPLT